MTGTAHEIRITRHGGPEVLEWVEVDPGEPAAGEARVRFDAVGLNFIDIYHRTGLYPVPLPSGLGMEAAGVVTAVGPAVTDLAVGDRVACATGTVGTYTTERVVPVRHLAPLPEGVDAETAAASMLAGLTARYLLLDTFPVAPGQTILFHAAAGGVGLIACQWAKALGARVIGTVSTEAKAEIARAHGCDLALIHGKDDIVARVRAETDGLGVPVVYDSVGKDTFDTSLDCLAPRGLMVSFGNASGAVPPFSPGILAQKGSLYLTRPTLMHYVPTREALVAASADLFGAIAQGRIRITIGQRFALKDAALAHEALASRRTTGATVLLP